MKGTTLKRGNPTDSKTDTHWKLLLEITDWNHYQNMCAYITSINYKNDPVDDIILHHTSFWNAEKYNVIHIKSKYVWQGSSRCDKLKRVRFVDLGFAARDTI